MSISIAGLVFLFVSMVFFGLVFRNYWTQQRNLTAKARIWLRLAIIFGIVAAVLLLI